MRRFVPVAVVAVVLLGAGVWWSQGRVPATWRAERPGAAEPALAALAGSCTSEPVLSADALLAVLVQDAVDPGCDDDERIVQLLAEHPDKRWERWLEGLLARRAGPDRLRLRASLALLRRQGLSEPVAGELASGRLSDEARLRLGEAAEEAGELDTLLEQQPDPLLDATRASLRWAAGDETARAALLSSLEDELVAGELPEGAPARRRAALIERTLAGLGLGGGLLEHALGGSGLASELSPDQLGVIRSHEGVSCEAPDAPCVRLLVELLQVPVDPWSELAPLAGSLEPEPDARLGAAWERELADLTDHAGLLGAAAALVGGGGARLLGEVAHPLHDYGPVAWQAGVRGDPAAVLVHAGGTPGAVAVAALVLGDLAGVPLRLDHAGEVVRLTVEGRAAWVGPCGPGAEPVDELTPLSRTEALDLARMERLGAALQAGDLARARRLDGAVSASAEQTWPRWPELRAVLVACEGKLPQIGGAARARAASWAAVCGHADVAEKLLEGAPGMVAPTKTEGCGSTWEPQPRAEAIERTLSTSSG